MKLKEFVEEKNFDTSLPDGDTFITISETEVESEEHEFEGQTKTRYKLKTGDAEYLVGVQVMRGIQEASKKGTKKVRITKTGTGLSTSYSVVAVLE